MSDKDHEKFQLDARPFAINQADPKEDKPNEQNSLEVYSNNNNNNNTAVSAIVNNNMLVNNQSTSSTNISFNECNGITLGNFVTVLGHPQWPQAINATADVPQEESLIYRKTPTIKAMMESDQRLNDKYLDIFCVKLGHKYQSVSVHLRIDDLDVQQAIEDHKQYGTAEVCQLA